MSSSSLLESGTRTPPPALASFFKSSPVQVGKVQPKCNKVASKSKNNTCQICHTKCDRSAVIGDMTFSDVIATPFFVVLILFANVCKWVECSSSESRPPGYRVPTTDSEWPRASLAKRSIKTKWAWATSISLGHYVHGRVWPGKESGDLVSLLVGNTVCDIIRCWNPWRVVWFHSFCMLRYCWNVFCDVQTENLNWVHFELHREGQCLFLEKNEWGTTDTSTIQVWAGKERASIGSEQ